MSKLVLFLFLGVCVMAVHMAPAYNEDSDSESDEVLVVPKSEIQLSEDDPRINWHKVVHNVGHAAGSVASAVGPAVGAAIVNGIIKKKVGKRSDPDMNEYYVELSEDDPRINWNKVVHNVGHAAGSVASAVGPAVGAAIIGGIIKKKVGKRSDSDMNELLISPDSEYYVELLEDDPRINWKKIHELVAGSKSGVGPALEEEKEISKFYTELSEDDPRINWKNVVHDVGHAAGSIGKKVGPAVGTAIGNAIIKKTVGIRSDPDRNEYYVELSEDDPRINWHKVGHKVGHAAGSVASAVGPAVASAVIGSLVG